MTIFKRGDVVLIAFVQSDGSIKKRPALVVLDIGDDDVLLAPITTTERKGSGDYKIKNWRESGLLLESWLRLAKISCLEKTNIERVLGRMPDKDASRIFSLFKKLFGF